MFVLGLSQDVSAVQDVREVHVSRVFRVPRVSKKDVGWNDDGGMDLKRSVEMRGFDWGLKVDPNDDAAGLVNGGAVRDRMVDGARERALVYIDIIGMGECPKDPM